MEEPITEPPLKNQRLKDLTYFSLAAIALVSLLLFVVGYMFTLGYYSGAGALWSGEQNEEMTVSYGFFILIQVLPLVFDSIVDALLSWKMLLFFSIFILLVLLFEYFGKQYINDKIESMTTSPAYYLSVTIFVFCSIVIFSFVQGKTIARDNIEKLLISGCVGRADGWNQCHQILHKDKLIHEGYLIGITSGSVIMFKRDIQALEYIKMPKGAILRRQFAPPEEVSGSGSP